MSSPAPRPAWRAEYQAELALVPPEHPPRPGDPTWHPFEQGWREGLEAGFKPGWARIRWNERSLLFDVVLDGAQPSNAARSLNERTWELGDICEIFLQGRDNPVYIELHVTPENQRLQLRWTAEGFAAFRKDTNTFNKYTISDRAWVSSASRLGADRWGVSALVPIETLSLGQDAFTPGLELKGAVCRYDCTGGNGPVHSSTAALRELSYHRREDWDRIVLQK